MAPQCNPGSARKEAEKEGEKEGAYTVLSVGKPAAARLLFRVALFLDANFDLPALDEELLLPLPLLCRHGRGPSVAGSREAGVGHATCIRGAIQLG